MRELLRAQDQLAPRVHAELVVDALEVRGDGLRREVQRRRDLAVGEALRGEPGDAALLRGQRRAVLAAPPPAPAAGRQLGAGDPRQALRARALADRERARASGSRASRGRPLRRRWVPKLISACACSSGWPQAANSSIACA